MKKQPLLPHRFKMIGWVIFVPVFTYWLLNINTQLFSLFKIEPNLTILIATLLISLIFIAFSKQKQEDEFVSSLRLNSWLWAAWINSALLLLADLFIYGRTFLSVVELNLFTFLIIFIIRFHYLLHKYSRS